MKSVLFLTMMLISIKFVPAQTTIWQQPEKTIRLLENDEVIAAMTPDSIDRQAIVVINNETYRLDFNADAYRCKIFLNEGKSPIAIGKKLQGKQKRLEFASGDTIQMLRTGKKKTYSVRIHNTLKLDFAAGNIHVKGNGNYSTSDILAQATLVFIYAFNRYKHERSNDFSFIPIIIPGN